ncbi:unnamed protein product [Rhizoctonia solani]|uniref:Uncharacterized protein n=1 Tax=Rhizoctonia solani TaxID=456999 RepID=A0A8H3GV33_9AGAM|nr:unnamed protein product [Rhizoctonia solani]
MSSQAFAQLNGINVISYYAPMVFEQGWGASTPVFAETKDLSITDSASVSDTRANSIGFLALPNELIFMIISHFPEIKTEEVLTNTPYIALSFDTREISPVAWERFQACLTTNTEGKWFYSVAKTLEQKCNGMLQSQHLWPHVKVVTVTLTRVRASKILPLFVRLLGSLPNVHTLEIQHACGTMTTALKGAFRGHVFPSIQKVILPTCTHEILRCCPEVREVISNESDGTSLVSALVYHGGKKLEVLRNVHAGPVVMKRLSAAGSPLRCIEVYSISENMVSIYATFPSLRVIEVNFREGCPYGNPPDNHIKLAKDILRACAKYKPPKNRGKFCGKTADDSISEPALADPDPEPRIVRLRKFTYRPHWNDWHKSPEDYVPFRIEDIPVTAEESN